MIGYFATLVIGIILGKVLFDKELRLKLYNRLVSKRIGQKRTYNTQQPQPQQETKICTMCNGDEFVWDTELKKQVNCPKCKGTGIEPINK
jgi:DnaJ-class molecular chaperone